MSVNTQMPDQTDIAYNDFFGTEEEEIIVTPNMVPVHWCFNKSMLDVALDALGKWRATEPTFPFYLESKGAETTVYVTYSELNQCLRDVAKIQRYLRDAELRYQEAQLKPWLKYLTDQNIAA